jgi:osmotically-inducible protein OsmY
MNPASAARHYAATDRELQERSLAALDSSPIETAAIGVTVLHGVVTLQGRVHSREEKWLVERVVGEITSVRAVANELEVHADLRPDDADSLIAEAAANALTWYRAVAPNTVKVIVAEGWLTLTGVVGDLHQRGAAERAVRGLRGVRGVSNALTIIQEPAIARSALEG